MTAVKDLIPGLILSHAVITPDGKTLLGRGGIITARTIALLSMWDINYVHIDADDSPQDILEDVQFTSSYSADISAECAKFFQEYNAIVTTVANSFDFVRNQNKVPILELKDTSFIVYSSILTTGPAIMDYLLISDHHLANEVSRHNVMVAYICGLIGREIKLSEPELQTLTLGGLLHDIGKMVISKTGSHEPYGHVINGGQLLRNVKGIPEEVMLGVLQHHEFLDGTGFPMGAHGSKIHPYAKIITIADIFHSETYKHDHCNPFAALNVLSNDMFGKVDNQICQLFIGQIRASLLHSNVILSDGRQAEVFYFPPSGSNSPIVQTTDKQLIDLSTSKNITISHMSTPSYITG
ncbi:MAG: metal dependent phosphohydrolase [Firmicutes bacterium]|nr:metal dependent phosphohydrolase [Bacillota bacterium]